MIMDLENRFSEILTSYLEFDFLIPKNLLSDNLKVFELKRKIEKLYNSFKNLIDEEIVLR